MENSEFKVVYDKKDLTVTVLCLFLIELVSVLIFLMWDHIRLGIFTAAYSFLLDFFILFPSYMFYVKVHGTDIEVRTKLGRKYDFHISEIERVVCSKTYGKYKIFSDIDIKVNSKNLCVGSEMTGFGKLAEYLLEKYKNGEINERAISESCQKELLQYKNKFA